MNVKCDWLDVTYSPDDHPESSLKAVLNHVLAECTHSDEVSLVYRLGGGVIKIDHKPTFSRVSCSGAALDAMRQMDVEGRTDHYGHWLSALSESPHTITRLDACLDVPLDAPPILRKLVKRYPRHCAFSRKALKTKTITEIRHDGLASGTWYAGHRQKAMVTARVYDKALQMLTKGVVIPPTTRYEITFRKGVGCSLRDAYEPERLFWSQAETLLLVKPSHVLDWYPNCLDGWEYSRPTPADGELLMRRIDSSSDLTALLELASELGHLDWFESLIKRKIDRYRTHAPGSKDSPGLKSNSA